MLKRKISKDEFEALPDALKEHYKASGADYILDAEKDDGGELKRAKDHEKGLRIAAETARDEALARVAELEEAANRGNANVTEVDDRWKAKEAKAKTAHEAEVAKYKSQLSTLLVNNRALEIANDISVDPDVILPHIQRRLKADLTSDEPGTLVLDETGNVTALSLDDLKKEFVASPKFARIIKQSDASGSGARPSNGGGGAPQKKSFKDMTDEERGAFRKADPKGFDAAVATQRKEERGY